MKWKPIFFISLFFIFSSLAWAETSYYTVKKGDTLTKVSRDCDVPVNVLLAVNNIKGNESLKVGMKLTIPDVYIVKKGDTLYSIAKRYSVSIDDLKAVNGLSGREGIKIKQKLYIVSVADIKSPDLTAPQVTPNAVFWPHPGSREPYDGKIRGVLINGDKGDLVYSVSSGRVIWAGPYRGFGNVVLVTGADELVYGYMGVEELIVSPGEQVESGTAIGRMGVYFHQTDAKLLFIVYHNIKRVYLDPKEVLCSSKND
jgi:LysM repeat protein